MRMIVAVVGALYFCITASSVMAEESPPAVPDDPATAKTKSALPIDLMLPPSNFSSYLHRDKTRHEFISESLKIFKGAAGADIILTPEEARQFDEFERSKHRSWLIQKILRYDLNGDFKITRDEIHFAAISIKPSRPIGRDYRTSMSFLDRNLDGEISIFEMANPPSDMIRYIQPYNRNYRDLISIDPNVDGKLNLKELSGYLRLNFKKWDTNNNYIIDGAEVGKLNIAIQETTRKNKRAYRLKKSHPNCSLPKPKTNNIIYIGAGTTGRLSSVTTVGQHRLTETATIYIEPGETKLYVIATSHAPMIWNITGATDRIERFVATTGTAPDERPATGVIGLKKEQLHFPSLATCHIDNSQVSSTKNANTKSIYSRILGKEISAIFTRYIMPLIALPSGAIPKNNASSISFQLPNGEQGTISVKGFLPSHPIYSENMSASDNALSPKAMSLLYELRHFFPYGIGEINPADVISNGTVEEYSILPTYAGLLQLVKKGHLTFNSRGFYYVRKPITHFPAGLDRMGRIKFILGKGVPMPKGDIAFSCVRSEETGAPMPGVFPYDCRKW